MSFAEQSVRAYELGHKQAVHDITVKHQLAPVNDIWETKDPQDILFSVTGQKLDVECEDAQNLIDAYENGYYEAEEWMN